MPVAYAVVPFVCAALLAVFIPVKRVRTSVPHLAIVLWLAMYNLVHGINAVIWDGNVENHAPVWCDIVTKLMLGANIALPGAFLCLAGSLELLSSSRVYSSAKSHVRTRTILELVFCYVIPFIYMALHLVAQDRRFDLLQDYGCSASVKPSLFPYFLVWIPPLIICSIATIFCVLCVSHVLNISAPQFVVHIESRHDTTYSIFNRRLTICMVTTVVLTVTRIFILFLNPTFVPWVSWNSAHAEFTQIKIATSKNDVGPIKCDWWGIFAVSVVFILLSYILGEETRDIGVWVWAQLRKKREPLHLRGLILPLRRPRDDAHPEMSTLSRSSSLTKPQRPLTLELQSGWDDMLDIKTPKYKTSFRVASQPPSPSRSTSTPSTPAKDDQAFVSSTLSYLGTPTAQSLGIASPPLRVRPEIPPVPTSPPPPPPVALIRTSSQDRRSRIERPNTALSNVLDASWPLPPTSPVPSLVHSRHTSISRPLTRSSSRSETSSPTTSEAGSSFGYPLYRTVTPPHLRKRPFEGSISSISEIASLQPVPVPSMRPLKSILKKPSLRSLSSTWSRESVGQVLPSGDIIHMTVVQETV